MIITINNTVVNFLEWTVLKGLGKQVEDFSRSKTMLFAVSETNKIPLTIESVKNVDENGTSHYIKAKIPALLEAQTYDLELIWVKNGRNVNRTYQENVFKIDENYPPVSQTIKTTSTAQVYGYDGLSAYEIAMLKAENPISENDWIRQALAEKADAEDLNAEIQARQEADDTKLSLSGGTMTGSINLDINGNNYLTDNVNKLYTTYVGEEDPNDENREILKFEVLENDFRTPVIGNKHTHLTFETENVGKLMHKSTNKTTDASNLYEILDEHNIKTINGTSLLKSSNNTNIDVNNVFVVEYNVTSFADILNAYNNNKIIISYDTGGRRYICTCCKKNGNDITAFNFVSIDTITSSENARMVWWFTVTNTNTYSLVSLLKLEDANNKSTEIVSSDTKYPTAKAVKDYAQPLPFVVRVTINPEGSSYNIDKTVSEMYAAHTANKQLRLSCLWAQYSILFEEDLCMLTTIDEQNNQHDCFVAHTVTEGAHYIVTIYEEDGATVVRHQRVLDSVIPDVSQFVTRSVNDLLNYYTKQNTYTQAEVDNLIDSIQHFHYEIYTELPQSGESNVLYLIGPADSGKDRYEEYVYANNSFTKIGDTSIDLSNYALKSQIKTVNENSLIGSGDVSIHPEIVNLTDTIQHSSGHYEDLMRKVDRVKLDTPQIFIYTAYSNNNATTAICFSTCTNTGIKQTLFLGIYKSIRTLSTTVSEDEDKYSVVDPWAQIVDVKQSDLDAKLSKSGGSMTGDLDLNDHALFVRTLGGNLRNGIKFENNATGVLVGNGSMYTTIQSSNADLKHRKGSADYSIIDASNIGTYTSNFITNSVNDLVNYYLKSETYTKGEVDGRIGAINQFKYEIAASTSAVTSPQSNVLYLIGPIGTGSDKYEEYVYPDSTTGFVKIGDTSIDLSGYAQTANLSTVATSGSYEDLTNKPTIPSISGLEEVANKTNDIASNSSNTTKYPSCKGVVDYIDAKTFVVTVGINPSDQITVNKTLSEIETAHNANKLIRINFTSTSGTSFEEDATRINDNFTITYVTHAVSDGKHYIVTIYEEDNVTKASYQEVLDSDKQDKIDSTHKLNADLVDDSTSTNKFVTSSNKTTWNNKQDALVSGTNIKTINNTSVLGSGNLTLEDSSNKTLSLSSSSTDTQYPSAKCVYDAIQAELGAINTILDTI